MSQKNTTHIQIYQHIAKNRRDESEEEVYLGTVSGLLKTGRRAWPMNQNVKIFGSSCRARGGEGTEEEPVKHGGGSVMHWGSFAVHRVWEWVSSTLSQKHDQSILQSHAMPSGIRLAGQGFILQQDNDRNIPSRCEETTKLERPAQATDLNSIGLVWDELDRREQAKKPKKQSANVRTSATMLGKTFQRIFDFYCRMSQVCSEKNATVSKNTEF